MFPLIMKQRGSGSIVKTAEGFFISKILFYKWLFYVHQTNRRCFNFANFHTALFHSFLDDDEDRVEEKLFEWFKFSADLFVTKAHFDSCTHKFYVRGMSESGKIIKINVFIAFIVIGFMMMS